MARVFARIDDHHRDWIGRQALFFVATAPLSPGGHVNVSPKGPIGSFGVIDDHTVAYLDVHGSGTETIAHLRENGRIVVMFCAFDGPPRILRIHGQGEVVLRCDPSFDELLTRADFENLSIDQSQRAVIVIHVTRVADSCGYGVPLMTLDGMRPHHAASSAKRVRVHGEHGYRELQADRGAHSLDGLPALKD